LTVKKVKVKVFFNIEGDKFKKNGREIGLPHVAFDKLPFQAVFF